MNAFVIIRWVLSSTKIKLRSASEPLRNYATHSAMRVYDVLGTILMTKWVKGQRVRWGCIVWGMMNVFSQRRVVCVMAFGEFRRDSSGRCFLETKLLPSTLGKGAGFRSDGSSPAERSTRQLPLGVMLAINHTSVRLCHLITFSHLVY